MIIGACTLELMIYEANSLKEKRQVIKSIVERIKSRYNVSIAEVGLNDIWRSAVLGIACVSNDTIHAKKMISSVIKFIDRDGRVEIIRHEIEIL
ncbi:DUF503 domain-containing protein [Sporosalibacterium faouarense]|uniref:DUF503 domain-containing protein n=1 Tax=Sporosalibacterium faouarense TaxID=516123 RepID=UPI00141C638A|nr:DUF503 domain-containing protein [Sporosalibacterium faouarense]MTI46997.1 DUF503 domain-containing protein [Bacillota bacterium]